MSGFELEEPVPTTTYRPSGKFSALALVPLLGAGVVVSLVMAVVLLLLESDFYYYFFTPALVGLPVFGATWAAVRFSNCRNALAGTVVGLVLAACYYLGYWELSYLANIVTEGPAAVAMVERVGGAPGLPGYINFRCKTSKPIHHPGGGAGRGGAPNGVDYAFNYVFFGGESLMIVGLAVAIGRGWSQRVYYEAERRWSTRFEFRLPPATLATVLRAIDGHDWAAIAALPRVSSMGNANTASLLFRVEYLKDAADAPAYITLSGANLPKDLASRAGVARPRRGVFLRQVAIDPTSLRTLGRSFADIKLGVAAPVASDPKETLVPLTPVAEVFEPDPRGRARGGKAAGAGPKADFRDRAVAATRDLLTEEDQAEPWAVDSSSCLPTGMGPRQVRSTAWWKNKVLVPSFLSAFAVMGLALWISGPDAPKGAQRPPGSQVVLIAGVGGGFALLLFSLWVALCGDSLQRRLLIRRLGRRPGSLLPAAAHLPTKLLRLEDAQTYHVQKLSPEDVCVCAFDAPNRRVLLEGVSHRYVIRAEDVTSFWPLQSGEKVSIRIDSRINDAPLCVVLAADNPMSHLFHGAFAHRALKSLVARFVSTFGRDFSDAGPAPSRPAGV